MTNELGAVLEKLGLTELISEVEIFPGNPEERLEVYPPFVTLQRENLLVSPTVRIDSFVKLECGLGMVLGHYVHIASFCHLGIGGGILIAEEGSSFGSGAKIITGSNIPGPNRGCSAIHPDSIVERSIVHVKRNATVFCGAIILPGVTIGEGAVVAAGAVVRCDIPDGETWAGVPARRVRGRKPGIVVNDPMELGAPARLPEDSFVASVAELYDWDRETRQ